MCYILCCIVQDMINEQIINFLIIIYIHQNKLIDNMGDILPFVSKSKYNQLQSKHTKLQEKIEKLQNQEPKIKYKTQYVTQYVSKPDPEAEKKINELQKEMKRLTKEIQRQKLKDYKAAGEKVKEIKNYFFKELQKQKFSLWEGGKSVVFIGRTSVGKSTLLNMIFKLQLKTSKMPCTKQLQIVFNNGKVSVFDCPGFDDNFNILSHTENVLRYFGKIEIIYYLYDGSIEQDIVNTALAMKKKIYFVRTKCDPDDNYEENESIRAKQTELIKKLGIKDVQLFLTTKKVVQGFKNDNEKLLKHIMS